MEQQKDDADKTGDCTQVNFYYRAQGAIGAELVDPIQKQLNIHYEYNQKGEECKETADEEHATGSDVPVEDLFAHLERLQKEIRANLEYSSKVFETLGEMAPGLIAIGQLDD
ncbi:hypothetical protein COCOBI_13-2160 [Coccomyxa sp. Obi]|nr:hypothetical protein COCOBI_13-2160 [Coccomyxa sp. Obi]